MTGGRLADHRLKLSFAVVLSVQEIVRTSKAPTFDTFTFAENVLDKLEASKRWRRLKARLKRRYPGLRAVGVWQRQERGAWHFHCVFDRRLDVVWTRSAAIECGFGPQLNMRAVGDLPGMKQGWGPQRVAKYLTRYITRDVSEGDPGVRLSDYCGDCRKATTAFKWGGGLARLYRLGCKWLFGAEQDLPGHERPRVWSAERQCWENWGDAFWVLVRLGWNTLTQEEKEKAVRDSDAVAMWVDPDRYPF
jgi:hypothetical protein